MLQVDRTADQATRFVPAAHPALPLLIGLGVLTFAGVVASLSPLVVLASGIVCILTLLLLWRPGEPPILLCACSPSIRSGRAEADNDCVRQ